MKLLIFGATGGTGLELVKQALELNHVVTAFVRNPQKIKIQDNRLRIITGDIIDYQSVLDAVQGQDVVISALGVNIRKKNTILSSGTQNIIHAMEEHNVKRFICVTSLGIGDSTGQLGFFFKVVISPLFLRNIFADKEKQESYIKQSLLDWMIVRPGQLTDGEKSRSYKVWTGKPTEPIDSKITRADVADFILKHLEDEVYLRQTPGLSY